MKKIEIFTVTIEFGEKNWRGNIDLSGVMNIKDAATEFDAIDFNLRDHNLITVSEVEIRNLRPELEWFKEAWLRNVVDVKFYKSSNESSAHVLIAKYVK